MNDAGSSHPERGTPLTAVAGLPPESVARLHGRWLRSVEDVLGAVYTPAAEAALQQYLELDNEAYARLLSELRAAISPAALDRVNRPSRLRGGLGLRLPDRSGEPEGD